MPGYDRVVDTLPASSVAIFDYSNDTLATTQVYKAFWCSETCNVQVYTKTRQTVVLKVTAGQIIPLQIYDVYNTNTTASGAGLIFGLYD